MPTQTKTQKTQSGRSSSRADRLAAMQEKLSKMNLGGGAGFWSAKQGRNVIRILPEVGTMDFFFQQVGKHTITPDGKKTFYCPKITSEGSEECPICEYIDELKRAGDSVSKKLADQMYPKKTFWMNIIDRSNESAGPMIFTPGVKIFDELSSIIGDPDYGDITDVDSGFDIVIEREGEKLATKYSVKARRNTSPLSTDRDKVDEWLEKAKDLSYVLVDDDPDNDKTLADGHAVYILPYDRLSAEFADVSLDGETEDEEPEEKPAAKKQPTAIEKAKAAVGKKPAKPVVEEVEDEDDDEDEAEDEDEDDVDKEMERRKARRRMR